MPRASVSLSTVAAVVVAGLGDDSVQGVADFGDVAAGVVGIAGGLVAPVGVGAAVTARVVFKVFLVCRRDAGWFAVGRRGRSYSGWSGCRDRWWRRARRRDGSPGGCFRRRRWWFDGAVTRIVAIAGAMAQRVDVLDEPVLGVVAVFVDSGAAVVLVADAAEQVLVVVVFVVGRRPSGSVC